MKDFSRYRNARVLLIRHSIIIIFILLISISLNIQGQDEIKINKQWDIFNTAKHDTLRAQTYMRIGNIYYYSIPDSALFYYQKAIDLSNHSLKSRQELNENTSEIDLAFSTTKASSLRYQGIIYRKNGNVNSAMQCVIDALKIYEKMQNSPNVKYSKLGKKGASACYLNLGNLHHFQNNLDKAMEYFIEAIKVKEEINDKSGVAAVYNNMANVYYDQANAYSATFDSLARSALFDKSIEYYHKALIVFMELQDKNNMSLCYNNLGQIQQKLGYYDKAIGYYNKSLKIAEELNLKEYIADTYANISELYFHLAFSDQLTELNYKTQQYREQVYLDSALLTGNKAYKLAVELGNLIIQKDALSTLKKTYSKLNRFEEALKYADIFNNAQDSLFNIEKTRSLTEMEVRYQVDKKERENKMLKANNELNTKTIQIQRLLVFFFGGALVLVTVMIWMMYRNRRKLKALNIKIQEGQEKTESANSDLKTKSEELEKFNSTMLDREMRIIELKKEVNKLAKDSNTDPPYQEVGDD